MRKPVIAGNWKMYKTVGEAVDTALALKPLVANANHLAGGIDSTASQCKRTRHDRQGNRGTTAVGVLRSCE